MAKKKTKVTGANTYRSDGRTVSRAGDWSAQANKLRAGGQLNTAGSAARTLQGGRTNDSGARKMMDWDRRSGFKSSYQNPGPALQGYTGAMPKRQVASLNYEGPKASLITGNKPDIYNPASKTPNSAKAVMASRRRRR